jgi:hypothetical protein
MPSVVELAQLPRTLVTPLLPQLHDLRRCGRDSAT